MSTTLKTALIQTNLIWENPEANKQHIGKKIEQISEKVDLIVLPEMLTSGFTMNAEKVAETMNGVTVKWMQNMAKTKSVAITGSLVIKEQNKYFNRLLFVHPNGQIDNYDKRHTFTLAGEHKIYTAGKEKIIIDYMGWKICPLICYDLRFPVWARNVEDYDLLLYVANWPKPRINAWDALLKSRAIENMSYCIGVNRVGLDGTGHEYPGHSAAYDVLGNKMDNLLDNEDGISIVSLEKSHIEKYRKKLNFLSDKDTFNLLV